MPTGYTAQLESHWDVARWLKQEVVRALGVCVCLRDNDAMTTEQILKALTPTGNESYYAKSLKESEESLKKALGKSQKAWAAERTAAIKELTEQRDRNKRDVGRKAIEYRAALKRIEDFQQRAKTEGGKCVAKFALDQLAMVKDEFEPCEYWNTSLAKLINTTVSEYAADKIASLRRSVSYAKEQLEAEQRREKERLEFYKGLLDDCETILGK